MSKLLLVATHNEGKVQEYARMLTELDVDWLSLGDLAIDFDVEETGSTFEANAILKAQAYARASKRITLADDSGLSVDALDGAPGVYTARYGGPQLSSIQRYELLLKNMQDVPDVSRSARFHCAIAVASENGDIVATRNGSVEGMIARRPSGTAGFGYDPVFYLRNYDCTMAELAPEVKHAISHRGEALRKLEPVMRKLIET